MAGFFSFRSGRGLGETLTPQNAGKHLTHEGGQNGGAMGVWGVSPHEDLKRDELPTPATLPRVGPKTLANPKPTGVGKRGSRGAKPPWRGIWGMCPPEQEVGASSHLSSLATGGTQNAGKP